MGQSLANTGSKEQSLDWARFEALTFDCYGTLIDWESGLLAALGAVLRSHANDLSPERVLQLYAELEPKAQKPYRRYCDVLAKVVRGFGERLGFEVSEAEAQSLPQSVKDWLPFPDTVASLQKLRARYKLAIISNTDDDLFAGTVPYLQVGFDEVITAEQAKAYKPAEAPFRLALERLGLSQDRVLHVGQSIYHDVLPAKSLGMATALVCRRGYGATRAVEGEADLIVPDLKTLASVACGNDKT
jgi:2-haloacid dehalogenase